MPAFTLAELSEKYHAQYRGDPNRIVNGIAPLQSAQPGQISFLNNPKYRRYLLNTRASVVILSPSELSHCRADALIVADPYFTYSQVASLFIPPRDLPPGIHPTAVIAKSAVVAVSAYIGPYVIIGNDTHVEDNVVIEALTAVGERCRIGADSHLYPNVTLYDGTEIGARVILHSGVVLGSDGFGIAKHKGSWHKIPQLGVVRVGDDVEIGANTTIDRGALGDTVIETGAKLDNQIQIGHNVKVGAHTAIAACVGIAGSTEIGRDCLIGGAVGINGHLQIADNVALTGMSAVTKSLLDPGVYSSTMPVLPDRVWKKSVARLRQLERLQQQVKTLEAQVSALTKSYEES